MHDPMMTNAQPIETSNDAPLFAPREIEIPRRRARQPFASTSREAYRRCDRNSDRLKVLKLIIESPKTCDEIAERLGRPQSNLSGRLTELRLLGWIEKTTERRLTRSGSSAQVWTVTPAGIEGAGGDAR